MVAANCSLGNLHLIGLCVVLDSIGCRPSSLGMWIMIEALGVWAIVTAVFFFGFLCGIVATVNHFNRQATGNETGKTDTTTGE